MKSEFKESVKMGRASRFSEAYKREAVRQAESSGNVSQTARNLGISAKSLHDWIKQFGTKPKLDLETASQAELNTRIRQLERSLAEKDRHIEVLKNAISIVSQPKKSDF
jgi:transposase-like protein